MTCKNYNIYVFVASKIFIVCFNLLLKSLWWMYKPYTKYPCLVHGLRMLGKINLSSWTTNVIYCIWWNNDIPIEESHVSHNLKLSYPIRRCLVRSYNQKLHGVRQSLAVNIHVDKYVFQKLCLDRSNLSSLQLMTEWQRLPLRRALLEMQVCRSWAHVEESREECASVFVVGKMCILCFNRQF